MKYFFNSRKEHIINVVNKRLHISIGKDIGHNIGNREFLST